ncbi:hypothetical protein Dimus_000644, partial [Dionaea muscipula]
MDSGFDEGESIFIEIERIRTGRIRKLKNLVVDAKKGRIGVVSTIVRRMMEKNAFLFGFLDINEYSGTEKVKEVIDVQNARIKKMHEMDVSIAGVLMLS